MEDPSVTKKLDNEDKALKSLLDTFGSAFSLEVIASAFCKAGRDATLVGDILCDMQTGPSADATHVSKGLMNTEISPKTPNYNDYDKLCEANRSNSQASKLKRNPTSVGSNYCFAGKEYVWRVAGSNKSPNATKPEKVEAHSVAPVSNVRGKNCVWRIVGSDGTLNGTEPLNPVNNSEEPLLSRDANLSSSDRSSSASNVSSSGSNKSPNATKPEKVEAHSVAPVSNVRGKNCVWRIVGSDGTLNGTEPLNPVNNSEEPLLSRDANLSSSDRSSSASNVSSSGSNKSPNATKPEKVEAHSVAPVSNVRGKNCVWRIVGSDGTLNGTEPLNPVNNSEEPLLSRDANLSSSDRSSSASNVSSSGSNKSPNATKPEKVEAHSVAPVSNVRGKNCVWRIVVSDGTLNGTEPLNPVNNSEEPLLSRDANLSSSDRSSSASNVSSSGSNKSPNATKPEKVEAHSVAPVSNVRGKNCVWRIVGSDGTLNGTEPLNPVNNSEEPLLSRDANLSSSDRSSSASNVSSSGSNKSPNATKPEKVEAHSVAPVSNVRGKNCVWRIVGSDGTLNGTEPLNPVNNSEEPLLSRDANLSSSDRSSSASNVSSNDDIENFLFEMLGHGSQLERSAIREVLGHCGHDMKKSMETLLDLMAVTLDKRNQCEEINLYTSSKSLSFENQVQKQSNESRTMRTNIITSRISSDSCEQADLIVSAPVLKNATRSWATREMVTEPLNDVAEDCEVKATSLHFNNVKDDAKEGSYYILRKAVKEHRETMKQYYKAAAEAFARGDRGRATLLLEKGQFFYNKAREADEESASKIFETSDDSGDGEMQEEMSLDLQDHNAKEAIRLVKIHLRTLSGIPMVREMKIIIGTGDQDAEKRKRLISKLLQREAIRWIEDETSGAILIRLDEINPKSLSFGRK